MGVTAFDYSRYHYHKQKKRHSVLRHTVDIFSDAGHYLLKDLIIHFQSLLVNMTHIVTTKESAT